MKKIRNLSVWYALILVFILNSCSTTVYKNKSININTDWKFKILADETSSEDYAAIDFNDADWGNVTLPHTAHLEPLIVKDQWQGVCWYRKSIDVPNYSGNKVITIDFEAAMNHSSIWVNGEKVSTRHGGYLPVVINITNYIKKGVKNIIAVRLDNTDNPVTGPKPLKILDFNMYGGLYRNVTLNINDEVYISHPVLADKTAGGGIFVTYPKVSKDESIINIKTNVVNSSNVIKDIQLIQSVYYDGKLVHQDKTDKINLKFKVDIDINKRFSISNAKLWSPKSPNLYLLKTELLSNGKIVEEKTIRFGIRKFTFKNNQLYINGEKTFLRGVNRHQDYPYIGYALSDNAQYRDAKKIKEAGFNYIRLSHYPQSPAFMDACDELGLVVIDAILGWQFYNDTDAFRAYCYRSAKELVRRDRNHPCVMAWEVSLNETKNMPLYFMKKLHDITHAEYPGKDVYSLGWKDEVYDIYIQARQHRILRPHPYADKPLSVSEYGDWEYYSKNEGLNQDKLPNDLRFEMSSRQARSFGEERMLRQALNVQEAHNDNLTTRAYSDSYWVMYDYNRGNNDNIEQSGLMDIFRLPKLAYYFYQSQIDINTKPILKIASYWNKESPLEVKVYSNTDEVKLYLNNKLISSQKPDEDDISSHLEYPPFTFNIEYFEQGELKAVGYLNGKEIATDVVKTPKKPITLKLWFDKSGRALERGVNDVVFLYIAAIDKNGTIVPGFTESISVNINGDLKILNLDTIKAEAGIATALVRIGKIKGVNTIEAFSEHLSGSIQFKLK